MHGNRPILIGLLIFAWYPLAWAQEETERFQFFADCQPMGVSVLVINVTNGERLEEQEVAVQAALESRLRSARLYREGARNQLAFGVSRFYDNGVNGIGFSTISMTYSKYLHDPATGQLGNGITASYLFYSQNSSSYDRISQATDQFIANYLRVNESACKTLN